MMTPMRRTAQLTNRPRPADTWITIELCDTLHINTPSPPKNNLASYVYYALPHLPGLIKEKNIKIDIKKKKKKGIEKSAHNRINLLIRYSYVYRALPQLPLQKK